MAVSSLRCRNNWQLVGTLEYFCKTPYKLSPKFLQQWKHFQQVGKERAANENFTSNEAAKGKQMPAGGAK